MNEMSIPLESENCIPFAFQFLSFYYLRYTHNKRRVLNRDNTAQHRHGIATVNSTTVVTILSYTTNEHLFHLTKSMIAVLVTSESGNSHVKKKSEESSKVDTENLRRHKDDKQKDPL